MSRWSMAMGSKIWIFDYNSRSIKVCVSRPFKCLRPRRWSFWEERKRLVFPHRVIGSYMYLISCALPGFLLYFRVVIIRKLFQLEQSSSLSRYLRFLVTTSVYKQRPDINPGGGLTEEEEKAIRRKRIQEVRSSMIIGKTLKWSKN